MNLKKIAVFGVMCASLAHASLTVPNSSYLGINETVSIPGNLPGTSNGYNLGYAAAGGGGEFLGTITNAGAATPVAVQVGFWCVDDQLYFNPTTGGPSPANTNSADIVALSQIGANASDVRYSGVTNGGTPGWTNTTANGSALPTTATARYEMAAYLVQQYTGFNTTISNANTAEQDAIQNAIWAITNNSSPTQQTGGTTAIAAYTGNAVSLTNTGYWVKQALANYATVDTSQFAVVSWGANPTTGALNAGGYSSSSPALQTFLVELAPGVVTTSVPTPEPGLYGAMALGLGGLFVSLRRRRKA